MQNKDLKKTIDKLDLSGFENMSIQNTMSSVKVHVWHDGPNHEWTFGTPDYIMSDDNSLLSGEYSSSNMIALFNVMPEIFAPVNEIASRVSSLKFVLKRFSDDEIIWDNKKFNQLFAQPNPLVDFKQHIWQAVVYEYLTGASFQYINKPELRSAKFDSIQSIINIPSDKVLIDEDENNDPYTATDIKDFIKRIYIKRKDRSDRDFNIDNVMLLLHPDLSKGNTVKRFKTLLAGAEAAIKNLIPVYIARREIYIKRGALGFIVSKKTDASGSVSLSPKEKDQMNQEFLGKYGVSGQRSLFPIASNEVDFVKTSASIAEMQPFDETATDARAIYATVRVPKHLCPTKDNSTFDNANTDMKSFYTDVIIPKGQHYAQIFTNYLQIDGHYIDIDTSGIEILQGNKKDESETNRTNGEVYKERFKNGICTLNDWIVATGGEKSSNPMYDKRLYEMNPDEVSKLKDFNLDIKQSTFQNNTL